MEKPLPTAPYHSLALTEPIVLLFNKTISMGVVLKNKISMGFLFRHPAPCASGVVDRVRPGDSADGSEAPELTREDVETLEELRGVFEGEEPSLEEVAEAFSVFDDDGDGVIEPLDLHRVLCKLGFPEGAALEACRRMIAAYDENDDGRIDFKEFIKVME
ncbi:probable calcium-binding protein CML46 [Musa acuminata AAA Group]|uniref:probable calcium-binding protein CML46 n=1 Tax=Musa acuminata AAA Group TaxID=214697 RepID=UPI0031CEE651